MEGLISGVVIGGVLACLLAMLWLSLVKDVGLGQVVIITGPFRRRAIRGPRKVVILPFESYLLLPSVFKPLYVKRSDLRTSDNVTAKVTLELTYKPDVSHEGIDRLSSKLVDLSLKELADILEDEISDTLREIIGRLTSDELRAVDLLRDELRTFVEELLEGFGLRLKEFKLEVEVATGGTSSR